MKEALEYMKVTGEIRKALLDRSGLLAPVYEFMLTYECADWQEVSRQMILKNLDDDRVQNAYTDALEWYRNLIVKD